MRKSISILLMYIVFLTVASPLRLNAQGSANQSARNEAQQTNFGTPDLRKSLAGFFYESPAAFDAKQMERESFNSAKRAKLSKGQKTGLYIGIAAAVAVAVVVIIVARKSKNNEPCYATCTAIGCPPAPPCP